jgi:hypothetical protein
MKLATFVCVAAVGLLCAAPADARPLRRGGIAMEDVGKILRQAGYPVTLGVDDEGDPKIVSTVNGVEFDVLCYPNAKNKALCASIQFSAVFNLEDGTTYERVNDWNRSRRYGQAWVDEEMDPFVDMNVELERGASTELIGEYLTIWSELTQKWKEHFEVAD